MQKQIVLHEGWSFKRDVFNKPLYSKVFFEKAVSQEWTSLMTVSLKRNSTILEWCMAWIVKQLLSGRL